MLLPICVPASTIFEDILGLLGRDDLTTDITNMLFLVFVCTFQFKILNLSLCHLSLFHYCSGVFKVAVVSHFFSLFKLFRNLFLQCHYQPLLLIHCPYATFSFSLNSGLVGLDAPINIAQQLLQLNPEGTTPLPPIMRMLAVCLESLLEVLIMMFATRTEVHLRISEHLMWTETQQEFPTDIVITELASTAFFFVRISISAHQAIEKSAGVFHDQDTVNLTGGDMLQRFTY
mmetsp:Transcript_32225/g.58679  ORF Transcript_32225/g.58679 Transcript_32225/m.58679 type:complete len:231 (+) Transcript_32225:497-1189(+)